MNKRQILSLLLALAIDGLLGDPPNRFHPVAWMGSYIAWAKFCRPFSSKPAADFFYGFGLGAIGCSMAAGLGVIHRKIMRRAPVWVGCLSEALILKSTFSLRSLWRAASQVQSAIEHGDLLNARRLLSWHLVSRDTNHLDSAQVTAATIESVAENTSDGVIAPLFYYALAGVPFALLYRFVNTADAMLGYHDREHEWLGKFAARLDDVMNFFPARITGLLILLAAQLDGHRGERAWHILKMDAHRTESPNAGYPMSAMAGALGVELEKIGHYRLGKDQRKPEIADIQRAKKLMALSVGIGTVLLLAVRIFSRPLILGIALNRKGSS